MFSFYDYILMSVVYTILFMNHVMFYVKLLHEIRGELPSIVSLQSLNFFFEILFLPCCRNSPNFTSPMFVFKQIYLDYMEKIINKYLKKNNELQKWMLHDNFPIYHNVLNERNQSFLLSY